MRSREAFGQRKYDLSLRHYTLLHRITRNSPEPDMAADFFQLRMAQCHEQLIRPVEAQRLFQIATVSKSAVIRGIANYHIAMSEERGGRYLQARQRAYLAASALANCWAATKSLIPPEIRLLDIMALSPGADIAAVMARMATTIINSNIVKPLL